MCQFSKQYRCRYRISVVVSWVLVLLSGCVVQSKETPVEVPGIRYVSGSLLERRLRIDQLHLGYTDTGTSRAWANVENVSKTPLELLARVVFVGEGKQKIEPDPSWSRIFLDAYGSTIFEGTSMSIHVHEAVLEIKEP